MLAHLQNVNFPSLLVDLNNLHVSFAGCFNGYFLPIDDVGAL